MRSGAFYLISAALFTAVQAHAGVPTDGLLVYLDAGQKSSLCLDAAGRVMEWKSIGREASCVFAPTADKTAPQYVRGKTSTRAVVRFDGTDDELAAPFTHTLGVWTAILVAAPRSNRMDAGGLFTATPNQGNDYDPGFTIDLYNSKERFSSLSVEGAGRIGGAIDQMRADFSYGGLHLIVVERGPDRIRMWIDGDEQDSRSVSGATTRIDVLRAGSRFYNGTARNWFDGDIAQLLLYNRILEPEEHATITRCLGIRPRERAREMREALGAQGERMSAPIVSRRWATTGEFARYVKRHPDRFPFSDLTGLPIHGDLKEAIALGMLSMNSMFDADKDQEPYFYSNRQSDGTGALYHSVNIGIPHVVGRTLWGTMIGELATGIPFPEEGLSILTKYCRSSFDNSDHLNSYIDPARENRRFVEFHNMREGLYGLVALIEGRGDAWAKEAAHAMLVTLDSLTDADGRWSMDLANKLGMSDRCEGMHPVNAARMIDPLLHYHVLTGDELAMKLAGLYARAGLKAGYLPDGRFAPMEQSSGHIHSLTSALSGITAYAMYTSDRAMLEQCQTIFDMGLPEYFSSWGWGDEVMPAHPANVISRGEMNQTGDVIRTAILLGRAVDPRYYEVAERFVRSMVIPSQHREEELRAYLRDAPEPRGDFQRGVLKRSVGGWAMQLPNDRMREGDWPLVTIDITSGATHALAECYRNCLTEENGTARLNMLFDVENSRVRIRSRLPLEGRIEFEARANTALLVRIPEWVKPSSVRLLIAGRAQAVAWDGAYVRIGGLAAGQTGSVTFDLPCRIERETVDGIEYTTAWVGNQIVSITPRGSVSPIPF